MFWKKRKSDNDLTDDDVKLLNEIDLQYMRAFSVKTVEGLKGYLTSNCLEKVGFIIYGYTDRYFADGKFRHTEWTVVDTYENILTLKKEVTYDRIRVNGLMSIAAADDYAEQWVVSKKDGLIVLDITNWKD